MIGLFALVASIVIGVLGWSGWWAIPLGILSFWGGLRALPEESHHIKAVGLPFYILGTLLVMKVSGWIASLF